MADTPGDTRLEQLERRVKADPTSVAFAALAEEYRRAGRFEEAIRVCRSGLTRHPAYLSARATLGRALVETGALDEAKAELDAVHAAAPENLAAIRALAEIHHHRRGDTHEAEEHCKSAVEAASSASPEAPAYGEIERSGPVQTAPAVETPAGAPADGSGDAEVEDPVLVDLKQFLEEILAARATRDQVRP